MLTLAEQVDAHPTAWSRTSEPVLPAVTAANSVVAAASFPAVAAADSQ